MANKQKVLNWIVVSITQIQPALILPTPEAEGTNNLCIKIIFTNVINVMKNITSRVPHVEAGKNTSTVIPASRKRRRKGNPVVSGDTEPAYLRQG
jgi:hypothetical protein